ELGEKQIQQEEQIGQANIKTLEQKGKINAQMLEAAAQRERENEKIAAQQAREDAHYQVQAEFQANTLNQQRQLVTLQQEVATAVENRTGLEKELAAYQLTAAASIQLFKESLSEVVQDMPELNKSVKAIADLQTSWVTNIDKIEDFLMKLQPL